MKRILIGILVFVLYLALVILGDFALGFNGMKFFLFWLILGLLGAAAITFVVWYLYKLSRAAEQSGESDSPDAVNLNTLLRDADARIRQAGRAGIKSLASLPLIYVVGDENSAKTQTVLRSGLDPELLAGNVFQDGMVVPTQLANLWLSGNWVLVEAGGALLRQPPLWLKLVKATVPARLGSVFSKDSRLPARSVVVCVSVERILAPNTAEQIRALAQTLNERLRQLSQTLGISLPVYVLFTKLDTVTPFADYVSHLTEEEVKLPVGTLLSSVSSASGLYSEQATAQIGTRFDQLLFALSEFRLDILSRGGELQDLARGYEFPRDLRKLRAGIVSFLAEVARPSQIGVNPFLRGFFFAGMRAHMVEDILDIGPAQAQTPSAPANAGATRIFSLAGAQQQVPVPQSRRGGTRKVPQWVFLPHLFSNILLADKSALEASRASTRTSFLKRALLATAAAFVFLLLLLITISFFKNRSLEERVAAAAAAPVAPVAPQTFAAQGDLQSLDNLRAILDLLGTYRKDDPPLLARMGLYKGDELYPVACQAYSNKFRALLLAPTQQNILAKLRALPSAPTPDADYSATYRPLKAYIITTSAPDPDTAPDTIDFLPSALFTEWAGNGSPSHDLATLARNQFAFYAAILPGESSCMANAGGAPNADVVAQARLYINGFQGFQHVYQSMLAAASRKVPSINFNSKFPGTRTYIEDDYPVPGAFTKDGFTFMQDAILHPEPYYRGEEWVLGPSSGPPMDRAALSVQLKSAYVADYLQTWRTYLNKAHFVSYESFKDAGDKLGALDSNTSAMLELFSLISTNTAVSEPLIANAFQAPQAVVPPASPDNRFIAPSNQAYIQSLQGLEGAVKGLTLNPASQNDPAAAAPVVQAAIAAEGIAGNLRNGFVPDPAGNMDKTSFELLEAPIESTKALAAQAGIVAASGVAKNFCTQIGPVLAKFPFNPSSTTDANPEEVAQIFAPNTGQFAQFINSPTIKGVVMQQGNAFFKSPNATGNISPAFLSFLSSAQKISSTLFSAGNQPSLDFTLTEVKSPGAPDALVAIDSQQITAAGQTMRVHWISSPSGHYSLSNPGNSRTSPPSAWSAFHLALGAAYLPPDRLKIDLQTNNQTNGVILLEVSGPGAQLLNPQFMRSFRCVSSVGR